MGAGAHRSGSVLIMENAVTKPVAVGCIAWLDAGTSTDVLWKLNIAHSLPGAIASTSDRNNRRITSFALRFVSLIF